MTSLPSPPLSVSTPAPPLRVSLPAPPLRTSLPPPPLRMSLPSPPLRVSLVPRPLRMSFPARPLRVSGKSIKKSITPFNMSLPAVPLMMAMRDLLLQNSLYFSDASRSDRYHLTVADLCFPKCRADCRRAVELELGKALLHEV